MCKENEAALWYTLIPKSIGEQSGIFLWNVVPVGEMSISRGTISLRKEPEAGCHCSWQRGDFACFQL
jgi:hypothetical protein